MTQDSGGCWPTEQQERLLNAALFSGPRSIENWEQWYPLIDLDDLDSGSYRLMPLLYRSLVSQGISAPEMPRYRGIYKRVWYNNQRMLARVADVLTLLHEHGIRTMLLKGAAQLQVVYQDVGARSMNDFDILVPTDQARAALDALADSGWITEFPTVTSRVLMTHSMLFRDRKNNDFDLHWHMLEECCLPEAERQVWERGIPVEVHGVSTVVPGHTDQLIHTIVHGLRWAPDPPIRWIADAVLLLRLAEEEIDWPYLIQRAEFCKIAVPLKHGLRYLASTFDAPIPESMLAELDQMPTPRREQTEFHVKTLKRTLWRRLRFHWFNYRRLREIVGAYPLLPGFVVYLRLRLGLSSTRQLLGTGLHKLRTLDRD